METTPRFQTLLKWNTQGQDPTLPLTCSDTLRAPNRAVRTPQLGPKAQHCGTLQFRAGATEWSCSSHCTSSHPSQPSQTLLHLPHRDAPLPAEMHPVLQVQLKCPLRPSPPGWCVSLFDSASTQYCPCSAGCRWLSAGRLALSLQPSWTLDTVSSQRLAMH